MKGIGWRCYRGQLWGRNRGEIIHKRGRRKHGDDAQKVCVDKWIKGATSVMSNLHDIK